MSAATLTQTYPAERTFDEAADEAALAELYEHPEGTVRLGLIRSQDGLAAGYDGSSRSLNGPEDLRILRVLRAACEVVVVGRATAIAEGYRDIRVADSLRWIRSGDPRLSGAQEAIGPDLAIATFSGLIGMNVDPQRTWIVTTEGSPAHANADAEWSPRVIIAGSDALDPSVLVSELAARGMSRVLCEGGPRIAGAFLAADAVDDYCLTTSHAPGDPSSADIPEVPASMALAHRLSGGGFTMERWLRG